MLRNIGLALFCLWPALCGAQTLPTISPEPGTLQPLATTDAIRPFAAVGRLDTGNGFCTATLISPDLVLTAAHCLFDGSHDARRPDSSLIFNAGLRNGRVSAQRGVRISYVHPGYAYGAPDHIDRVRTDIALLRLDRPIADASVQPLSAGGGVDRGDEVQVVSYGEERADFASLEEGCEVLAERQGVLVLSCSVVQGSSGAPVMVETTAGFRVVSVVSASAHWRADPVALSADLEGSIDRLMQMANAGSTSIAATGLPQVRSLTASSDGRDTSGARFIRP